MASKFSVGTRVRVKDNFPTYRDGAPASTENYTDADVALRGRVGTVIDVDGLYDARVEFDGGAAWTFSATYSNSALFYDHELEEL